MTTPLRAETFLGLTSGVTLGSWVAAGVLLGLVVVWRVWRSRLSPAERERQRRLAVQRQGRTCAGNILDFRDGTLHYSYVVAGVEYTASQDISTLGELLPANPITVIGPGSVKYMARNPANSIVVGEQWSGLRLRPRT